LTTISLYSQIGWVAAKVQIENQFPNAHICAQAIQIIILTKRLTSLVKDVF
jgi:hypothetical protein